VVVISLKLIPLPTGAGAKIALATTMASANYENGGYGMGAS
jgi:hypothetical protein